MNSWKPKLNLTMTLTHKFLILFTFTACDSEEAHTGYQNTHKFLLIMHIPLCVHVRVRARMPACMHHMLQEMSTEYVYWYHKVLTSDYCNLIFMACVSQAVYEIQTV
jgi:hypothetical protein